MKVELVDSLGTDLTVVNAARVSFNKHRDTFQDSDEGLIKYLAAHGHWTPFGHPQLQLRISAPIFVARQLVKHQIGLVWNEVSRRYVAEEPKFYGPVRWRGKPKNAKQGSSGVLDLPLPMEKQVIQTAIACKHLYQELLEMGVAPEQARMVLPLSMYTEWYWTGSLMAFARVCNLRLHEDAQEETQEIARQIDEICATIFPISWKYLVAYSQEEA
jgi:thymidylate synthase (FAD)